MNAGTRIEQTPTGIKIGSAYQPGAYEVRTPDEYRAFRPAVTQDGARLQAALIHQDSKRFDWEEALACVAFVAFMVALIFGLPLIAEIAR